MGLIRRTERPLGLSPTPCRRCRPPADRLVSARRWAIQVAGVPLLALDARWRRCVACDRGFGVPRLGLATATTGLLVAALLVGLGVFALLDPRPWLVVGALFVVWGMAAVEARLAERRLLPLPRAVRRGVRLTGPRRRTRRSGTPGAQAARTSNRWLHRAVTAVRVRRLLAAARRARQAAPAAPGPAVRPTGSGSPTTAPTRPPIAS